MRKKLSIAIAGLTALCSSYAWAGGTGNGWAAPVAKTHYTYCFGGGLGTGYFSSVITSAPAVLKPEHDSSLATEFDAYLKTLHVPNNGGQCFTTELMADILRAKKQREDELIYRKWKVVETSWTGAE